MTSLAAEILIEKVKEAGFGVIKLNDLLDTRLSLSFLKFFSPDCNTLFYLGHGDIDRLYGTLQLGIGLFSPFLDLQNSAAVKDMTIISIACLTGIELGPNIINSARAYAGCTEPMYVAWNQPERNYATDFVNTWLVLFESYLAGETLKKSIDNYKSKCTEFVNLYKANKDEYLYYDAYFPMLENNRDNYKLFGDADACLKK